MALRSAVIFLACLLFLFGLLGCLMVAYCTACCCTKNAMVAGYMACNTANCSAFEATFGLSSSIRKGEGNN